MSNYFSAINVCLDARGNISLITEPGLEFKTVLISQISMESMGPFINLKFM